jgi:hypothetical protein
MEAKIQRHIPTSNDAWPLYVEADLRGVRIFHDAQRERDQVHLNWEEWMKVAELIPVLRDAMQKVSEIVDGLPKPQPQEGTQQ